MEDPDDLTEPPSQQDPDLQDGSGVAGFVVAVPTLPNTCSSVVPSCDVAAIGVIRDNRAIRDIDEDTFRRNRFSGRYRRVPVSQQPWIPSRGYRKMYAM